MVGGSDGSSQMSTPRTFTNQSASAEELLKSQTVGLVNLSDFRKRRAEVLEQKEREAQDRSLGRFTSGKSRSATPSSKDIADGSLTPDDTRPDRPSKKKKRHIEKSKLSFGDDEQDDVDTGAESTAGSRGGSESRSLSKTPRDSSPRVPPRKLIANPNAPPPPKALTKASLEAEAQARDSLRKEFLAIQDGIKNAEILIPFIFYDGTNIPAGPVRVKKGDAVWVFLDRCRKVGAQLGVGGAHRNHRVKRDHRREWARISVDDLVLVRGDIIVPHHYEFYYFITNRVPNFSSSGGLLFDFSNQAPPPNKDPLSRPKDEDLEGAGADPTLTKVVDRRWYERNKHIYPASLWREYEPGEEFVEKMRSKRRDAQGNVFFF